MSPEQDKKRTNDQTDKKPIEDLEGSSGGCGRSPNQDPYAGGPVEPPVYIPPVEVPPVEI